MPVSQISLRQAAVLQHWQRASLQADGVTPKPRSVLPIGLKELKGKWAFQTACWRDARFEAIELQRSYRTAEPLLINGLHELRVGYSSHPAVMALVDATRRPLPPRDDGIKPTVLYPIKRAVEQENNQELAKLDSATEHTYKAKDSLEPDLETSPPPDPNPDITPTEIKRFGENCPAPEEISLRLGAQASHTQHTSRRQYSNQATDFPPF